MRVVLVSDLFGNRIFLTTNSDEIGISHVRAPSPFFGLTSKFELKN